MGTVKETPIRVIKDDWCDFVFTDYSKGFGGKYGVQTDRKDASAVGWDHQEKLEQHESQKGWI